MKVFQLGDTQLGWAQYGLHQRLIDFEEALERAVDLACKGNPDKEPALFLWTGDIFDSRRPPARSVVHVTSMAQKLNRNGYTNVGISGNHDNDPTGSWLDVCGVHTLNNGDRLWVSDITVSGWGYTTAQSLMQSIDSKDDDWRSDIVMIHQTISEACNFGHGGLSGKDLVKKLKPHGVRYIAMGHIHQYLPFEFAGVQAVYSGSLEMTDSNEPDQKYMIGFDIEPGAAKVVHKYYPLKSRKVLRYVVNTETELKNLMALTPDEDSMVLLQINKNLDRDIVAIEKKFSSIPCRITPFSSENDGDMDAVFSRPVWEQDGAVVDLQKAVADDYKENTEEHQMILSLLAGADVSTTVNEFMEKRGFGNETEKTGDQ